MQTSKYLLDESRELWDEMLSHAFLRDIGEGNLEDQTFHQWLRQDYEFVRAALPFVSAIKSKAPAHHLKPLAEAELALHDELDLFQERAENLGVDVSEVARNLTTQSYIQHLMASAYREDYPTALTVYWTAEKAYHESWKQVEPHLSEDHEWYPFVENWAGEAFAEFVEFLGGCLNEVSSDRNGQQKQHLLEQFQWTVRYEIAFWDMAYGEAGEEWLISR